MERSRGVVTGSSSGIGAAVARSLRAKGHEVIGVDLHEAEVTADLGTPPGRESAVDQILGAGGELSFVVAAAGVGRPGTTAVAVNYFGVTELLEGLRPALAADTPSAVVAISSYALALPGPGETVVDACLEGDEERAVELAGALPHHRGYAASKLALARWVRREATSERWIGSGINLNAVAPGIVDTPLVRPLLEDPAARARLESAVPMPIGEVAAPDDIAGPVEFLLGAAARFICGQTIFVDGGADAVLRPDHA